MKKLFLLLLLVFAFNTQAQVNPAPPRICGTGILPASFENWVHSITPVPTVKNGGQNSIQSVFNIPVIVHVIHNNEAVNNATATTGANLNSAQIQDQINILNKDFNGLNPDTNLIPLAFKPLLGKFQVNFCLAVVNPTGGVLPEPGIDRINRVAKGWTAPPYSTSYITSTIKPNSIWNTNLYMNMWVCAISGGVLGYATFPNPGTSGLSGLSAPFGTATTDGLVMLNTAFGSIGTAVTNAPYHKGRTATHEIGHWMGLRHIWGDGTCATDYCNDTPPAQNANFGCPIYPYKLGTCVGNTTGEMTMNYMDYTDDLCMYMFSKDQKNRAQLIMTNSPMRAALITSTVCNLPNVGNDVGISFVTSPTYSQVLNCVNLINPIVNLTNYGSSTLTSALFSFNVNGVNTQTLGWTGNLLPNSSTTVALSSINGLVNGAHVFSVNVSSPNGGPEVNLINNNSLQQFSVINLFTLTASSATVCAGNSATLIAGGAASYTWSSGGNTSSVTLSPLATSVYTVTGANGACVLTKTTSVLVNANPTLSVNSGSMCSGNSFTITATGAGSYSWNGTGGSANYIVSPLNSAQYTVTGSNGFGCTASQISTVSVIANPTVTCPNVTICPGGTATLSASGASTYSWNTGSSNAFIIVSPASNTTYTVTGTNGACVNTKTVSVSIGNLISINISPSLPSVCNGNSATLTASGATSYTWSTGSNSNVIVVSPLANTVYTVSGLSGNCSGSNTVTVVVNSNPVSSFTTTAVSCFGGSNGQIQVSSTGASPFSYTYSSGSSSNLPAGAYTIITQAANGCKVTNTVSIIQAAILVNSVSVFPTSCPNACDGSVGITTSGGTSPYTYSIAPAGTNSALCAGNYSLQITDANTCSLITPFVIVPGNNGLSLATTGNNISCSSCSDGSVTVNVSSGTAPYTYNWAPGNYTTQSVYDLAEGCYTVTVTDALGCTGSSTICLSFNTGINNLSLSNEVITLSPNPNGGKFELTFVSASKRNVEIIDVSGRVIKELKGQTNSVQVDISGFADGIYYARISSENKLTVLKVVKN